MMDKINFDVSRKLMQLYELLIIFQLERAVTSNLASREWSENYDRDTILEFTAFLTVCNPNNSFSLHNFFQKYYIHDYLSIYNTHYVKVKIPAEYSY